MNSITKLCFSNNGYCSFNYCVVNDRIQCHACNCRRVLAMVKPRRLSNAYLLFDKSPERIPVARNDLGLSEFMSYPEMGIKENGDPMPNEISGCVIKEGNGLDRRLAINLLSACSHEGGLEVGQIYHAFFLKTGLAGDQFVGTSLVDMYAKCGDIGAAVLAFKQMAHADVASYNCLISGYGGHGMFGKAFDLFLEMGDMGLEPNHYTYAIMLTICGTLSATEEGKQLHAHVVKMQYLSEVVVGNALLTMYNKYGMMEDAESLFDGLAHRNLITWTTIINGFYQHGDFLKALGLLCLMRKDGVEPNEYAFTIALACCGSMKNFYISRMFHALVTKRGMNENDFILTALLNMYSGVGEMDYAKRLLKVRGKLLSVVSWNALISGFVHNQKFEEAMEAFSDMVKNNVTCDKFTYSIMLKACSSMPSLAICKQLHSQVVKLKYESDTHVGSSLIEAYTNCGSPEDSEQAFNQILKPDVVSWNSMIKCYSQNGHPRKAMFFFRKMVQEGIKPTNSTFLGILSACSHSGLVQEGQEFFNKMVARYNILPEETHYSSMVDLLGRAGQLENALDFIKKLPIKPTASIWRPLLAACRSHKNIQIAEFVAKQILDLEPYDATVYITLYNIYSEAGRPLDAEKQRKLMVTKEVVKESGCSWIEVNNKIYEFFSQDKTHPEMQKLDEKLKQIMRNIKDATGANLLFGPEESQAENEEETVLYHSEGKLIRVQETKPIFHRSFKSSPDTYSKLIETYARDRALHPGRVLHADLITKGLARKTEVASNLIFFYTELGRISDAQQLFEKIPKRNIRRWIVMIGAYARRGYYQEALNIFCEMQSEGLKPNRFVIPSILKACGHLFYLQTGEKIHSLVFKNSFEFDDFVMSALIDMYSKCDQVEKAKRVFDGMVKRDIVALNALVSGYVQHRLVKEALNLVKEIRLEGMKPNLVTWNTLIAGFSQMGDQEMVSELFRLMDIDDIEPDVVSWTSVISGLVQNFQNDDAFNAFKRMLSHDFLPSSATISSILPACSTVANRGRGKEIHGYAVTVGAEDDIYVRSALVDMYAKCGFISEARILFYKMPDRNTVTCNSMIFGYANHGFCKEAIELFYQMEKEKKPDHLTFMAVLTACSHAGLVELGQRLFESMQGKYQIVPRLEHYACIVDLLGRAGKLVEAYDVIKAMPVKPNLFVWGALLGACRNHGNIDLAEVAAKHLAELEPTSAGNKLLLSSLYANAGSWVEVARLKKMMKRSRFIKFPGCSWIERA